MTPLREGDNVHVKSFKVDGKLLKAADRPRSYMIDTPRGEISGNRRHLVNISKNIHRFIFILSVQGIIGKLGRPGKSASGYSVILRCHWRVSVIAIAYS